jgi:hypothetical protein
MPIIESGAPSGSLAGAGPTGGPWWRPGLMRRTKFTARSQGRPPCGQPPSGANAEAGSILPPAEAAAPESPASGE